jgi:hypothetical protein
MNEHIEDRQHDHRDIAECMNPGGAQRPDASITEKIDDSCRRHENRHNQANAQQPGRDVGPLHCRSLPIHQVADEGAYKTGYGNRHQHRMNGMTEEAGRGAWVGTEHDTIRVVIPG